MEGVYTISLKKRRRRKRGRSQLHLFPLFHYNGNGWLSWTTSAHVLQHRSHIISLKRTLVENFFLSFILLNSPFSHNQRPMTHVHGDSVWQSLCDCLSGENYTSLTQSLRQTCDKRVTLEETQGSWLGVDYDTILWWVQEQTDSDFAEFCKFSIFVRKSLTVKVNYILTHAEHNQPDNVSNQFLFTFCSL